MKIRSALNAAVLLLTLSALSGCSTLERWACGEPCHAENTPADGTAEDFTLAEAPLERATISAPFVCDDLGGLESFGATVETHGSDDEIDLGTWLVDRLLPALQAEDLAVVQTIETCGPSGERTIALAMTDWRVVDDVARTVVEVAEEDDLAVAVLLLVEPHLGACPDIACGS